MIRIMFVCHGNICRSPMAEFVLKDMIKKEKLEDEFYIVSSATSTEEIGNPVHGGTTQVLEKLGISTRGKYAVQLNSNDYNKYDYFIGMDSANVRNMNRMFKHDNEQKICKLLAFVDSNDDVDDPWYTGKFDKTYEDVARGCKGLLDYIRRKQEL